MKMPNRTRNNVSLMSNEMIDILSTFSEPISAFLSRVRRQTATLIRHFCLPLCLSVCPSRYGIVSNRMHIVRLFRLDALALSVIATATWLGGRLGGWLGGWLSHSGTV